MKKFFYYILASPIYLLTLLPFPVLYLLSDFFYFIMFYGVGYRKKIVLTNLKNSFPEKSDEALTIIRKDYYSYLIDLFIETFKASTMTKKQFLNRCVFDHDSLLLVEKYRAENRNLLMVMGHYGQFEWSGQPFSLLSEYKLFGAYRPLRNGFFEWFTKKVRERNGTKMVSETILLREMMKNKNVLNVTSIVGDQTPSNVHAAHWMNFLNQDTPVFVGAEKIAKKFNYPVIYTSVHRIKRGYYKIHFQLVADDPKKTPDGFITETFMEMLEKDIRANPDIWLWSHRRWKHKKPVTS